MKTSRTQRAFNLTELLVVVAIILILVSVLIVGVQSIYANAMQLKCQHRLEQIGHALEMYSSSHGDTLPKSWDPYSGRLWYQTLAAGYLTDYKILACPSVGVMPVVEGGGAIDPAARDNVDDLLEVLRWLKDKQEKSGSYEGAWRYKTDGSTTGHYKGVTGLALLTFFGFGCTDKHPPEFSETIRKAIQYLCSPAAQQKDDTDGNKGWFTVGGYKIMYEQAICTMALCGAARICQDAQIKQAARHSAQLGLDYTLRKRPQHGGYYYGGEAPDGKADTSLCGWVYQSIAAARVSGINPTEMTWSEVEQMTQQYLDECMGAQGGSCYWYYPPYTGSGQVGMTPISLTARVLNGGGPGDPDSVLQANWLVTSNRHINQAILRDGKNNYHLYYKSLALFRMGGDYWSKWYEGGAGTPAGWEGYPKLVLKHKQNGGTDDDGNPMAFWETDTCYPDACGNPAVSGTAAGRVYTTCMAAMTHEAAFEEHWIDPTRTPPGGRCSYGYNNRLGKNRRTPAADTILVMDYEHWEIDHDDIDVESNDDIHHIAARHSGRANALMGDHHVRAFPPEEITAAMWTLEQDN